MAYAIYSQPSPPSPQMEQAKFAELPCFQLEQPNICCCCHLWQREGTAAGILKGPIVPTDAWVGWVGGRQPRSQRVSNSGCGIDIGVRALQVRMHKPGLSKQAGMLLQARRMADTNQKEVTQVSPSLQTLQQAEWGWTQQCLPGLGAARPSAVDFGSI